MRPCVVADGGIIDYAICCRRREGATGIVFICCALFGMIRGVYLPDLLCLKLLVGLD